MTVNLSGIENPAAHEEDQHLPANPLQPLSKSWVERFPLIFGRSKVNDKLPSTTVIHPCVINGQRVLVYEKGLSGRDPAALARLKQYAQENSFGLKEDQRSGRKKIRFEQRVARTMPALMLAGGLFMLNHAAYAAGSSKFRDWLLGAEAQAMPVTSQSLLDDASEACLGCHDGRRGQYIGVKSAGSPMQFDGFTSVNHPVGMDYLESAAGHPRDYQPNPSMNSDVRLVNGKVTCVSCHQVKGPSEMVPSGFIKVGLSSANRNPSCTATGELTAGPRVSDLCLSCHIK